MDQNYTCEQCGGSAALCVSEWGYVAALCDVCRGERRSYMKLPASGEVESAAPQQPTATATV